MIPSFKPQRGVSLIELMVALLIGLLLIAGAVTVYMQSRNTYRTTETAARLQEVGRYAMGVIEPDIRLAGFWGLTNRPEQLTSTNPTITNTCGAAWLGNGGFLEAFEATYSLTCTATNRVTTSDVLTVRRADSRTAAAVSASNIQIQSNRMRATIFNSNTIPSDFTVAGSETRDMVANVYYISRPAGGPFSLRRRKLAGTTMVDEEVIQGVQDLQVQFGIDTNNDESADVYVNPAGVGTGRIVAARIWLLIVADEREMGFVDNTAYAYANASYTAFNDQRRRLLMTKTIQIRNSRP
jgi:type IV pilus assembly protein PilW